MFIQPDSLLLDLRGQLAMIVKHVVTSEQKNH